MALFKIFLNCSNKEITQNLTIFKKRTSNVIHLMLISIISDIHSNYPALESVTKYIEKEGIQTILCAGDIVGYYTFPNECCTEM